MKIREGKGIAEYLRKRGILKPYLEAKAFFLRDDFKTIDAKPRQPKSLGVFQFRINRKYRAFYKLTDHGAIVFKISDHQ